VYAYVYSVRDGIDRIVQVLCNSQELWCRWSVQIKLHRCRAFARRCILNAVDGRRWRRAITRPHYNVINTGRLRFALRNPHGGPPWLRFEYTNLLLYIIWSICSHLRIRTAPCARRLHNNNTIVILCSYSRALRMRSFPGLDESDWNFWKFLERKNQFSFPPSPPHRVKKCLKINIESI